MTTTGFLAHHGLGGGRVLVGVVGVGRIGVHGGHVLAQHAAGRVDIGHGQLFGGQFRRGQIGQRAGFRPQAAEHESVGLFR